MAVGQIFRSQPFYVTWEVPMGTILKGSVVIPCTSANGVVLTAGTGADIPPYGVALQAGTSASPVAAAIPVCWKGIVEAKATTAAVMYNNQAVYASNTGGIVTHVYVTSASSDRIIGYIVDSTTAAASLVKIRLGAW
jgi:hypothetical protein